MEGLSTSAWYTKRPCNQHCLLWVGYYRSYQVIKFAQKESIITWDLDLSEIKIWVTPPAKSPKPTDVLANEEGVLQRVEEKGDNDEHLGTHCSTKQ